METININNPAMEKVKKIAEEKDMKFKTVASLLILRKGNYDEE